MFFLILITLFFIHNVRIPRMLSEHTEPAMRQVQTKNTFQIKWENISSWLCSSSSWFVAALLSCYFNYPNYFFSAIISYFEKRQVLLVWLLNIKCQLPSADILLVASSVVKGNVATFEVNMTNHSQYITKNQFQ